MISVDVNEFENEYNNSRWPTFIANSWSLINGMIVDLSDAVTQHESRRTDCMFELHIVYAPSVHIHGAKL